MTSCPGSVEAISALRLALGLLADLGIPVFLPKLEGPRTTVTFLGIVIDSERMELRLPQVWQRLRLAYSIILMLWLKRTLPGATVFCSLCMGLLLFWLAIVQWYMCTLIHLGVLGVVLFQPMVGGCRYLGRTLGLI